MHHIPDSCQLLIYSPFSFSTVLLSDIYTLLTGLYCFSTFNDKPFGGFLQILSGEAA